MPPPGVLETVDELNDGRIIAFDGIGDVNFSDVAAFQVFLLKADAGAAQIGFGGDAAEVVFDGGVTAIGRQKSGMIKSVVLAAFAGKVLANAYAAGDVALQQGRLRLQAVALGAQGAGAFARRLPDLIDEGQVRREEQGEGDGDRFFPNRPSHVHGQVVEYQAVNCTVILSPVDC